MADVGTEDFWESFGELEQTNNMPEFSGITVAPGMPSFSPNVHGPDQLASAASDLPDQTIHGSGYNGDFPATLIGDACTGCYFVDGMTLCPPVCWPCMYTDTPLTTDHLILHPL